MDILTKHIGYIRKLLAGLQLETWSALAKHIGYIRELLAGLQLETWSAEDIHYKSKTNVPRGISRSKDKLQKFDKNTSFGQERSPPPPLVSSSTEQIVRDQKNTKRKKVRAPFQKEVSPQVQWPRIFELTFKGKTTWCEVKLFWFFTNLNSIFECNHLQVNKIAMENRLLKNNYWQRCFIGK